MTDEPPTASGSPGALAGRLDVSLVRLASAMALGLSGYHMVVAYVGPPVTEVHRALHLMLGLSVLYCLGSIAKSESRAFVARAIDLVLLCAILVPCLYLIINIEQITSRMIYVTPVRPVEMVMAVALTLAVLEATRRMLGWPMVILAVLFLIYTQIGPYLPYPFWHRGYPPSQVIEQIYLSLDGLWGIPIGASASYIYLFVLFGALLVASGAGAFFTRFANAFAGRLTGGPAKTAVMSSAMMSMLSGSSTANVVTTGSFTIPAMKSYGYRKEFAGGVEALASTGGLITPPIMGAAAFIMADFLGISYVEVMAAATIPAILYFTAIFLAVDLEARKTALKPSIESLDDSLRDILKEGLFMIVPLAIMVYFLVAGFTPMIAGFYGILAFCVSLIARFWRDPMKVFHTLLKASIEAPRMMAPVIAACAVGGLIAGIISLTGLGVRFTSIIALLAGNSSILFLILTMVVCIILGMGMPTSAVYIVLAAVLAPGLVGLGFEPLAVHMFIFFGAVMSNITPPLAIASFAAAAVAGSDPWKTSICAVRIAAGVFFIPFIFVYSPALVGLGSPLEIATSAVSALFGLVFLSVASIGWMRGPLRSVTRVLLVPIAALMILPGLQTDLIGLSGVLIVIGIEAGWRRFDRRAAERRQAPLEGNDHASN
ncbi:MAG: TRAP transporter fused permease subunit [Roseitalea sp.]|jgi:TRAP transporter 4TM/12TM fusion protein|nr:TRAP transporter fused permease subunit [Roseitalea sp.]MBO6721071.1 TRAP transporter fused permease subunit [Roseitalea sp.]MBO6742857.1 TRAP transporter fused permease subunit [Roseitalea sp.]